MTDTSTAHDSATAPAPGEPSGPDTQGGPTPRSNRTPRRRKSAAVDKALIRQTLELIVAVADIDENDQRKLARLLDCDNDPREITFAVLTTGSTHAQAIGALTEMASMPDLEAGITAASMSRNDLKSVWATAAVIGAAKGTMPKTHTDAAMHLVKGISSMTPDSLGFLETASTILDFA